MKRLIILSFTYFFIIFFISCFDSDAPGNGDLAEKGQLAGGDVTQASTRLYLSPDDIASEPESIHNDNNASVPGSFDTDPDFSREPRPSNPFIPAVIINQDTGTVDKELYAGGSYKLVIYTQRLDSARNFFLIYFRDSVRQDSKGRFIEFRIDPQLDDNDFVPVNPGKDFEWEFDMPDSPYCNENGILSFSFSYIPKGQQKKRHYQDYYYLSDPTPDEAYAQNDEEPYGGVWINAKYWGSKKSDQDIDYFMQEFPKRYLYATKGYVKALFSYVGRDELPENGEYVAGFDHDYVSWWNSLSHDLSGTGLTPLDPNNPNDLYWIRVAYYNENLLQLTKDLYTIGKARINFVEGGYGLSSAGNFATVVGTYGPCIFKVYKNNEWQYGMDPDVSFSPFEVVMKVALHEDGHNFGLLHPPDIYDTDYNTWRVLIGMTVLEYKTNVMTQGSAKSPYITRKFYIDKDWKRIYKSSLCSKTKVLDFDSIPVIRIPYTEPVGDNIYSDRVYLKGYKNSGGGIIINGQQVVAPDSKEIWTVQLPVQVGVNNLKIEQALNGRLSHPYLTGVTRLHPGTVLPYKKPSITLEKITPSGNSGKIGKGILFEVKASSSWGLRHIKWWVEKKREESILPNHYVPVPGMEHTRKTYGSAIAAFEYSPTIQDSGKYKIKAIAEDNRCQACGGFNESFVAEFDIEITD